MVITSASKKYFQEYSGIMKQQYSMSHCLSDRVAWQGGGVVLLPPVDEHSQQQEEADEGQGGDHGQGSQPLHAAQAHVAAAWPSLVGGQAGAVCRTSMVQEREKESCWDYWCCCQYSVISMSINHAEVEVFFYCLNLQTYLLYYTVICFCCA